MMLLVGEFRTIKSETVRKRTGEPVLRRDGTEWVRHEAVLLVGQDADTTLRVELAGKELLDTEDWVPEPGTVIAFECSLDTRASANGDRVYRTYKGWRLRPEVAAALSGASV